MNKKLFLLPLIIFGGRTMAQTDVTMELKDLTASLVNITISDEAFTSIKRQFTVNVENGKVAFHLEETTPRLIGIHDYSGNKNGHSSISANNGVDTPDTDRSFSFISVPEAKVKIKGTWKEHKISGHPFYKEMYAYKKSAQDVEAKQKNMYDRVNQLLNEPDGWHAATEILKKEQYVIEEELAAKGKEFIASHPKSTYSVVLAVSRLEGKERTEQLDRISPKARNSFIKSYAEAVADKERKLKEAEENQRKERDEKIAETQGKMAPDFTLPSPDGTSLTLSSLRGKVVVLDFWGKWCGICMAGMPRMKAYYEKYAGKLEFLGVDYGDKEDVWKQTVEENGLNWKHVLITPKNEEQEAVVKAYGVTGYPTKFILSPEGKIIKGFIGETPEFYRMLDDLMRE